MPLWARPTLNIGDPEDPHLKKLQVSINEILRRIHGVKLKDKMSIKLLLEKSQLKSLNGISCIDVVSCPPFSLFQVSDTVVEPYNAVLSFHQLVSFQGVVPLYLLAYQCLLSNHLFYCLILGIFMCNSNVEGLTYPMAKTNMQDADNNHTTTASPLCDDLKYQPGSPGSCGYPATTAKCTGCD